MVIGAIVLASVGIAILVAAVGGGDGDSGTAEASSDGPGAIGIVLIIGSIVASFALAGWLGRRILRRTQRADVLEHGVPATAVVTAMTETGTTVNQHPMVEFDLRITRDDSTYDTSVTQLLPRLLLGRVAPGTELAVRVMPGDRSQVAIDWESLDGVTTGGPATRRVPEGLMAGAAIGETVDTREFLHTATPAEAEIDQMSETGVTVPSPETGEDLEVFSFVVTVHNPGGLQYEATLLQGLPAEHVGRVGPGATVPIGINPDDAADIAIDWKRYAG